MCINLQGPLRVSYCNNKCLKNDSCSFYFHVRCHNDEKSGMKKVSFYSRNLLGDSCIYYLSQQAARSLSLHRALSCWKEIGAKKSILFAFWLNSSDKQRQPEDLPLPMFPSKIRNLPWWHLLRRQGESVVDHFRQVLPFSQGRFQCCNWTVQGSLKNQQTGLRLAPLWCCITADMLNKRKEKMLSRNIGRKAAICTESPHHL